MVEYIDAANDEDIDIADVDLSNPRGVAECAPVSNGVITTEFCGDNVDIKTNSVASEITDKESIQPEDINDLASLSGSAKTLGRKELKALKKSKYYKVSQDFDSVFVLQHKKTKQVVEMRAASWVHACNMIGWRHRHVRVLEERMASHISTEHFDQAIPANDNKFS